MSFKGVAYPLSQSPLYRLQSRSKLASILGVSNAQLRELAKRDDMYREFDIPKKDGGVRHVEDPCHKLKAVQTRLAKLLSRVAPPDYLFCPVKGRCYVSNAAKHSGNRVVHCLDIRKYFPSTPARRVFWFFKSVMKCEADLAAILTTISTYQEHLPTGSPLSPILSYFAHYDVWEEVAAFCKGRGYILTVYIDDCTISGAKVPAIDIWKIKQMIHRSGLRYHKEKTFIDRPAEVTGVILRAGRTTAPYRQYRKLKSFSNALEKARPEEMQSLRNRALGLTGQIAQIARASTQ